MAGIEEIIGLIIVLIIIYIILYPIYWITNDAKKRGKNGIFWGVATVFFYALTAIIYLIVRPKGDLVKCQYCGKEKLETLPQCPHCKGSSGYRINEEVKPKIVTAMKKVYDECQNCGEITDDLVFSSDGRLLCQNCINEGIAKKKQVATPQTKQIGLPSYTLIVEVKNVFNKEPLPKATVSLWKDAERQERISDIDGKVIFGKVKEGVYSLIISSKGFDEITQEVNINKNDRLIFELHGKATLNISVLDAINHEGIADAIIRFGDMETITDEKGIAVIEDISFGKYDIAVTKESYFQESATHDIKDIQQNIKISLNPDIKLEEEYRVQGEMLKNSLNESMKKLSLACDMCIPDYYRGICYELIKLNEAIASTPVYIYADGSSGKINTLYRMTGQITRELENILTNSENINEFITLANNSFKTNPPGITISPFDYHDAIQSYMSDTNEFSRKYKAQILNKLQETDRQITNNLQTFNINPIANLWSVSHNIIANAKNESDEAASLLLANILLDNTRKMFTLPEISRILRKKITLT